MSSRLGWALFGLQITALLGYAARVDRKFPRIHASADTTPDGTRFGKSETARRFVFKDLMRGEWENREAAEKMKEGVIWNRNHDSYFHQNEWGRVLWWSRHDGIPDWQGWLILDEGLRAHWPAPPGQLVVVDEAPLLPRTRPLGKRPILIPLTPEEKKAPPAAAPPVAAPRPVAPMIVGPPPR